MIIADAGSVMNVGLYSAAAAMNVNQRWLEATSENLAGQVVPGFKKEDVVFGSFNAGQIPAQYRNTAPGQPKSYLYPIAAGGTNFSQGSMRRTEVPTDLAIDGKGFFVVELPGGQQGYTRDGEFHITPDGMMVTKEGLPVLSNNGPILIDPLSQARISIAADGTVRQGQNDLGKINVVEFSSPGDLTAASGGIFISRNGGPGPSESTESRIRQGYLESSNVSTVKEMSNMILAMRNYEANQKLIHTQDERLGKTIQSLGDSAR
jgi:flagellar basal-body rod protein FlgF